ncbi:lactate utilization protein [Peptococcaceae bacterium 1198_IL3148]
MEQLGIPEQDFINTVARALGRSEPLKHAPQRDIVGPPDFWQEDEEIRKHSLELFKKNLEGLSGRVVIAQSAAEVQQQVKTWLTELEAKNVICWDHGDLKELLQPETLGVNVQLWNDGHSSKELIDVAARADVGITWINFGIAYTGSMAVLSGARTGRSVSLLPPTHIGICKRSQIVPTMTSVIKHLVDLRGQGHLPATINFITGPSRTSDIEMDLSIGVHGPYRTWVIVLDEQ